MQEGRPLAYASRALRDPETRYATIERKWDIKHTPTSPFNSKANGKVGASVKSDNRLRNKTAKGFQLSLAMRPRSRTEVPL